MNQPKVLRFNNDDVKNDIILDKNFLSKTSIKLNYTIGAMEWFDFSTSLCPSGDFNSKGFKSIYDMVHIHIEEEVLGDDWLQILLLHF